MYHFSYLGLVLLGVKGLMIEGYLDYMKHIEEQLRYRLKIARE